MNNINLCCFADENMNLSQDRLIKSFIAHGGNSDKVFRYSKKNGVYDFEMPDVSTDSERGCNYWAWKPFVIKSALNNLRYGEWLIYIDSGIEIIKDLSSLILPTYDITVFHNRFAHMDWCKMDTLKEIIPYFDDRQRKQMQASVILLRKSFDAEMLISNWMYYCRQKALIDDTPSVLPNIETFKEHRHDQAILTNLIIDAINENWRTIKVLEWDLFVTYPNHIINNNTLFLHHRMRNQEYR